MQPLDPSAAAHTAAPSPAQGPSRPLAQALEAHQDALRSHFPLPDLAQLQREAAERARRRRLRLGSGTTAAALLTGLLWWADPAYQQQHYTTAQQRPTEVTLADGSQLTLDANTQLQMSWHLRSRQLTLTQGRVLLQVAPATYRPFTVQADRAQVRVLGTRFEVQRQQDAVSVALLEGHVDVNLRTQLPGEATHYALQPGMTLALDARHTAQLHQRTPVQDWTRGELVFERQRLDEVLAALQRYVPQPIRLADPTLAALPVSGAFRTDQIDTAFALLPLIAPVQVQREADGTTVIARRR